MDNEQSVFSFDLNESLFFEKGQEVAEIRGVSLDPDISIQSFDDYISIRGVVELKGEYEKMALPSDNRDAPSLDDYQQAKRYIEEVVDIDAYVSEFNHRFPIEISVPSYRVNSLEDVTVRIALFDYELPEAGQLNLMSTIEIHGINNNEMKEDVDEEGEENTFNQVDSHEGKLNDTFEFEIKKRKESDVEDEEELLIEDREEEVNRQEPDTNLEEELKDEDSEEKKEEESDKPRWKKEYSQTLAEFFDQDVSKESSSFSSPSVDSYSHDEASTSFESGSSEISFESNSQDGINLRYLTGIFRDEEESYTQMRLCIVQENDTLETIAERYGTTSMHIANQNRLADDTITQGQLLYIPYKKKM